MTKPDEITPAEKKSITQHIQSRAVYNEAENYCLKVEVKSDKVKELKEPKKAILVLGNNRVYIFKPGGKLYFDTHLWEMVELRVETPKELTIKCRADPSYTITADHPGDIAEITEGIFFLWNTSFPGASKPLRVYPPSLVADVTFEIGPCEGFALTYLAVCDYLQQPPAPEIIWQVESYFGPKNIQVLDFDIFGKKEKLIGSDMVPIMNVLMTNTFFKELHVRKASLTRDGISALASTVTHNICLTKLVLSKSGITRDGCEKIMDGLVANYALPLVHLDLSGNQIEDKGFSAISEYLKTHTRGLITLDLSDCGATRHGTTALLETLTQMDCFSKTLTTLNLSGNRLDSEGSVQLGKFQMVTIVLTRLGIANSMVNFHELRKCVPIKELDLSGNKITKKAVSDLAKFLHSCPNLRVLNLSKTFPQAETFTELFRATLSSLKELNLADNELTDEQMFTILEFLGLYGSLTSINLSGNFAKSKQKHRQQLVEALISLVTTKNPPIKTLTMHSPKHPMKTDFLPFLLTLLDPKLKLKRLDICGHEIGDVGASSIGKVLQTNRCLKSLAWDGSGTSLTGLEFVTTGLHRNGHLTENYIPVCDVAAILKKEGSSSTGVADQVYDIVEDMQARAAVIARDKSQGLNPSEYHLSEIPGVASRRSLKPRKRKNGSNLEIKTALSMYPESKHFDASNV